MFLFVMFNIKVRCIISVPMASPRCAKILFHTDFSIPSYACDSLSAGLVVLYPSSSRITLSFCVKRSVVSTLAGSACSGCLEASTLLPWPGPSYLTMVTIELSFLALGLW